MNKKRYWKKQLYNANIIYQKTVDNRDGVFTRAFNIVCEINDYLFNLEEV